MWNWIIENWVTILALLAVLFLVGGAVFVTIRDRRKGHSSCGGNCAHCPMGGSCHGNDPK